MRQTLLGQFLRFWAVLDRSTAGLLLRHCIARNIEQDAVDTDADADDTVAL